MERKIGEIFEYNGERYQCIVGNSCENCAFNKRKCYTFAINDDPIGDCCTERRKDNKDVIFKKLEKVGEPYDDCGTILQRFKIYTNVTDVDTKGLELHIYSNDTIGIEIKQTKEDMEEKKLNLKPFDIQKAREGKPVCTRDGRKARIICFDFHSFDNICCIIAAISHGESERISFYDIHGKYNGDKVSELDLMMPSEKKEGWVNVYKGSVCISVYPRIYKSREEAVSDNTAVNRIDTVKICWEE